ncbi:MAG: YggU family protein [Planctomycetes bacterium]|nr:YggU family protein [Planctomycetota bacterium]
MLKLIAKENGVLVSVKVVPGASRTRYMGVHGGAARVAVAAPPEKGKANRAVIALLAEILAVKKRDVTVVSGHAAPLKTIQIAGITPAAVRAALQAG